MMETKVMDKMGTRNNHLGTNGTAVGSCRDLATPFLLLSTKSALSKLFKN